jgi:hypothetical protein
MQLTPRGMADNPIAFIDLSRTESSWLLGKRVRVSLMRLT